MVSNLRPRLRTLRPVFVLWQPSIGSCSSNRTDIRCDAMQLSLPQFQLPCCFHLLSNRFLFFFPSSTTTSSSSSVFFPLLFMFPCLKSFYLLHFKTCHKYFFFRQKVVCCLLLSWQVLLRIVFVSFVIRFCDFALFGGRFSFAQQTNTVFKQNTQNVIAAGAMAAVASHTAK